MPSSNDIVTFTASGMTARLLLGSLQPIIHQLRIPTGDYDFEAHVDKHTRDRPLLVALFHALLHFGDGTVLKYRPNRFQYFKELRASNSTIFRPFVQSYGSLLVIDTRPRYAIYLGRYAGYTSVIPLHPPAYERYLIHNDNQLSQFEFTDQHIVQEPRAALGINRLYVQAAARLHGLFRTFPGAEEMGELKRQGNPRQHQRRSIRDALLSHIQGYFEAGGSTPTPIANNRLCWEVYQEETTEKVRRRWEPQITRESRSKDDYDIIEIAPRGTVDGTFRI